MLCLSVKTEYALIALAYMAERVGMVCSAREIAATQALPEALLMQILKNLHGRGVVHSTRGARGGYELRADLDRLSLYDLIRILEGKVQAGACDHDRPRRRAIRKGPAAPVGPIEAPMQAFHLKIEQFLRQIKLSDLILPGRRIDVPLERLRNGHLQAPRHAELAGAELAEVGV
jgi:Rrf2 family protein